MKWVAFVMIAVFSVSFETSVQVVNYKPKADLHAEQQKIEKG